MKCARVLFGESPQLTRDIIAAEVSLQADMEVVGQCANVDLELEVLRTKANVVIVQPSAGDDDGVRLQVLAAHHDVMYVQVEDEGHAASIYECRGRHLTNPSAATLLEVVRRMLHRITS